VQDPSAKTFEEVSYGVCEMRASSGTQIEAEALAEMNASQTVVDVEAVPVRVEDHSSAGSLVA